MNQLDSFQRRNKHKLILKIVLFTNEEKKREIKWNQKKKIQ